MRKEIDKAMDTSNRDPDKSAGAEETRQAVVLVIDDNVNNIRVLIDFLKKAGYETAIARTGRAGLERARLIRPDLILLDIMMPDMDGFETCRLLKEDPETLDIPVIFMTALNDLASKTRAFSRGGVDYIAKPAEQEEVLARVSAHVRLKRRAEALREARLEADRANRAKSVFLANMSHELRTPLTGILGYADLLERSADPRQKQGLRVIRESGRHLLSLINDILDLAKIESGKLELEPAPCRLLDILWSVVGIIRARAGQKGLALRTSFAEDLPDRARIDARMLRQVLLNLLGNAVKFTEAGAIDFAVARASPDADRVRFSVADTGIGIPEEDLPRIFEPFQQTGDAVYRVQGTGLGLAISRRVVERMGGCVQVESRPGAGSRFWFDLDLPALPPERDASPAAPEAIGGLGRIIGFEGPPLKVLIVDDNAESRLIFRDLLTDLGFEIREAARAGSGLEIAAEWLPDALIVDMVMPEMDGMAMIRGIRAISDLSEKIIIATSASAFEADRRRSLDAGADLFLPKPLDLEDFLDRLGRLLRISWRHAPRIKPPRKNLSPPPPRHLESLLEQLEIGDMESIHVALNQVASTAPECGGFIHEMRALLERRDIESMERRIRAHLKAPKAAS